MTEALQAHTPPHSNLFMPPCFQDMVLYGHLTIVQIITLEQRKGKANCRKEGQELPFSSVLELMLFVVYLHYLNNGELISTLIFLRAVNIVENYTYTPNSFSSIVSESHEFKNMLSLSHLFFWLVVGGFFARMKWTA